VRINKKKNKMVWMFFAWIIIQTGVLFSAISGDIVITEYFYNKSAGNLPEYVELFNNTESSINLNGWELQINDFQVQIDSETFYIGSHGYGVILSSSGLLRSEDETTYCSSSHYGAPFNVCDVTIDSLFWRIGTFSDLSNDSGRIIIWDNSDTPNVIDSVKYNVDEDFPVDIGRASVFIIDPKSENAHVKNDYGFNWRSSEYDGSNYLWNGSSSDYGSPLSSNFITPTINIDANSYTTSDSTKNTVCTYEDSKMVCRPPSDGYPGGYAAIELASTAIDSDNNSVLIDSLYWEIINDNVLEQSNEGNPWYPDPLHQDTVLMENIYTIPLITRSTEGFLGKTDATIYIEQEINQKPSVERLTVNEQSTPNTINIFENTDYSIVAEVTDPELCSSINEPCNFDSLTFKSSLFNNSSPFLWTSDSIELLSDTNTLISHFTSPQIDSLHGISANNNPATLIFKFTATDPFGDQDSEIINIIVHNINEPPVLNPLTDQTSLEDTPFTFDLIANDPDGDELTFYADADIDIDYSVEGNRITIIPMLDYNGIIEATVNVTDGVLIDSQPVTLTLTPVNDQPTPYSILPDLFSYNDNLIDTSSFFVVNDTLYYYRLPQNSDYNSIVSNNILRFQWEKNDLLDPETSPELNNGNPLFLFYRLEAILNDSIYIILKDSINHQDFIEDSLIFTEINVTDEFPYYSDMYEDHSHNDNIILDNSGETSYKWRVIAQNYPDDPLISDPYRISSGWENAVFRIDLIQPEISNMDIILNDMYPGYYDLLWNSSEAILTDATFLSINEETNQFSAISMLNPRKVTDNLIHFTGFIPTDLTSVTITFDLQLRDNSMNSGERIDEISYVKVNPDSNSTLSPPSDNVSITLSKYSVSEPVQIIIKEENNNILCRENEFGLTQITPMVNYYPKGLIFNNPASIAFNMRDYISDELGIWQLVIVQIIDNEPTQLVTKISDNIITASINNLGDFAVFKNPTLDKPLPSEVELKMNYPNPFNSSTTIPIELPEESFVEVAIYNILGEKIAILFEGIKSSGYHDIHWNGMNQFGRPVSSGIYFASVHFGQKIYNQKIMLLK